MIPRWVCRWDRCWVRLGEVALGLLVLAFFGALAATVVALNLSMLSTALPWVPDPFAGVYHTTDPWVGIPFMLFTDVLVGYFGVGAYLDRTYGPADERRAACRRRAP